MKKYFAWVGAVAVIAAMGFSGYAVADAPDVAARNLGVTGWTSLAGPVIFQSPDGAYGATGGPAGVGVVFAGHKCATIKLDGASTDGGAAGPDNERNLAYATLSGMYPGLAVSGTELLPNGTYLTGRLRVCLTGNAPTGNVLFNYLVLNVGFGN